MKLFNFVARHFLLSTDRTDEIKENMNDSEEMRRVNKVVFLFFYLFDTFVLVVVFLCVFVFVFQSLLKAKPPITEDDFKEDFQRQVRP